MRKSTTTAPTTSRRQHSQYPRSAKAGATSHTRDVQSTRVCQAHETTESGQLEWENDDESIDIVRERVRQRIHARVRELQALEVVDPSDPAIGGNEDKVIETLHHDVVQTAAQILGRYLQTHENDSVELPLVHRMLMKEAELQALQRQRR